MPLLALGPRAARAVDSSREDALRRAHLASGAGFGVEMVSGVHSMECRRVGAFVGR